MTIVFYKNDEITKIYSTKDMTILPAITVGSNIIVNQLIFTINNVLVDFDSETVDVILK